MADAPNLVKWPHAAGEMAVLVASLDWATTPLGAADRWPAALRTMVEAVLASPMVATLACGPERLLIYNDAAARLYGDRHPAALGRPRPVPEIKSAFDCPCYGAPPFPHGDDTGRLNSSE